MENVQSSSDASDDQSVDTFAAALKAQSEPLLVAALM